MCAKYKSGNNILINISWIFSLISLASRIVSDDYNIVSINYRDLNFKCDKYPNFNLKFVKRVIFRWMDVIGRIGILSLTWVGFNGQLTTALIGFELFVSLIFTVYKKELKKYMFFCCFCFCGCNFFLF